MRNNKINFKDIMNKCSCTLIEKRHVSSHILINDIKKGGNEEHSTLIIG